MKPLRPGFAWLAALMVLAVGCARAEPPTPLLWKVSDGDNHIYLLGSFHALKPADYPLAPSIGAAMADATTVVFELPPAELNSPDLSRRMTAAARLPAGQTLQDVLPDAVWQRLQDYCQARNLPVSQFRELEPWFVALVVGVDSLTRAGYDPKLGLDRDLMARADRGHKVTLGLESADDQIRMFEGMSANEQAQALVEALKDAGDTRQIDRLHELWREGNDKLLYEEMAGDFREQFPALYQLMDVGRNDAWLPKLRAMLDKEHSRNALVVVGSLHLLGNEGLVARLRAAGYKVERVR